MIMPPKQPPQMEQWTELLWDCIPMSLPPHPPAPTLDLFANSPTTRILIHPISYQCCASSIDHWRSICRTWQRSGEVPVFSAKLKHFHFLLTLDDKQIIFPFVDTHMIFHYITSTSLHIAKQVSLLLRSLDHRIPQSGIFTLVSTKPLSPSTSEAVRQRTTYTDVADRLLRTANGFLHGSILRLSRTKGP